MHQFQEKGNCVTFYSTKFPVAKKEHACEWCSDIVSVGEKYATFTGIEYSGDFHFTKWHLDCKDAADRSFDESDADWHYDPYCDEKHGRGKTCNETPCENAA